MPEPGFQRLNQLIHCLSLMLSCDLRMVSLFPIPGSWWAVCYRWLWLAQGKREATENFHFVYYSVVLFLVLLRILLFPFFFFVVFHAARSQSASGKPVGAVKKRKRSKFLMIRSRKTIERWLLSIYLSESNKRPKGWCSPRSFCLQLYQRLLPVSWGNQQSYNGCN